MAAPAVSAQDRARVVAAVSSRLVCARVREFEDLRARLQELSVAVVQVHTICNTLSNCVEKELAHAVCVADASANGVTASEEDCDIGSFSHYFGELISYLSGPPQPS